MNYTIYYESNGQILRNVQTSDNIDLQLQVGESYIDGIINTVNYYIQDGAPVEIPPKPDQYAVFDYTTKQWVDNANLAIADVSQKRQRLLYASDWTQIPNGPLTSSQQAAWAVYRQELRDITQQSGYPLNVIWPTIPT